MFRAHSDSDLNHSFDYKKIRFTLARGGVVLLSILGAETLPGTRNIFDSVGDLGLGMLLG